MYDMFSFSEFKVSACSFLMKDIFILFLFTLSSVRARVWVMVKFGVVGGGGAIFLGGNYPRTVTIAPKENWPQPQN